VTEEERQAVEGNYETLRQGRESMKRHRDELLEENKQLKKRIEELEREGR